MLFRKIIYEINPKKFELNPFYINIIQLKKA